MNRQILAAIILASLAALLTYYYLSEKEAAIKADSTPMVVLIAKQPIGKGTKIRADKVTLHEIPGAFVMPGSISGSHAKAVKQLFKKYNNQYAVVEIAKGEQILPNKLSNLMPGFAGAVKEGQRIMAFTLPLAAAVGGQLKPGNNVDVLGTFEHQFRNKKRTTSVVLVQNVVVTSVGTSSIVSQSKIEKTSFDATQQGQMTISLSLTPEDALRLSLAEQEGRLKLILRATNDDHRLNLGDSHLGKLLGPLMRVRKEEIKPIKKRIQIIKGLH